MKNHKIELSTYADQKKIKHLQLSVLANILQDDSKNILK